SSGFPSRGMLELIVAFTLCSMNLFTMPTASWISRSVSTRCSTGWPCVWQQEELQCFLSSRDMVDCLLYSMIGPDTFENGFESSTPRCLLRRTDSLLTSCSRRGTIV